MEIEISKQIVDQVTISIKEKLDRLSSAHRPCIFKVHDKFRKLNKEAYEPELISIGPYYHGNNNLRVMEEQKFRYFQQVLQLNNESSLSTYVMAMKNSEERARKFYAESIDLHSDQFVEMMLLDGFFIIQFLRKWNSLGNIDPNDYVFHSHKSLGMISRDLILVENQIPFFIVDQLFEMAKFSPAEGKMVDLALRLRFMFQSSDPINALRDFRQLPVDNVNHILGLIHKFWTFSFAEVASQRRKQDDDGTIRDVPKCVTELQEAGVELKMSTSETALSLFDIKFEDRVLVIPQLSFDDNTECIFRNLIAYEQDLPRNYPKYVTEYAVFMEDIVTSAKDVKILRHEGIIKSLSGENEVISAMFNKLGRHCWTPNNCYHELIYRLNQHCRKSRNIWWSNLRRNYFNSPWSIISLIAAVVLLLLTLTQTIFSILSYLMPIK